MLTGKRSACDTIASKPPPTEDGQSVIAWISTKNAMLEHSLFLKSGKSWIVYKQCACS
jgi:hypothetical protein